MKNLLISLLFFGLSLSESYATAPSEPNITETPGIVDKYVIPGFFGFKTIKNDPNNIYELKKYGPTYNIQTISFTLNGKTESVGQYLNKTGMQSIIVLQDDNILYEKYTLFNSPKTLYPAYSISKSLTSMAIGSLIYENIIISEEEPMGKYASFLNDTAYSGVTFQQALRQSSAVETLGALEDAHIIAHLNMPWNGWENYLKTKKRMPNHAPGDVFNYAELDPIALAVSLRAASGYSLAEYLQEKLWKRVGMSDNARYQLDHQGHEAGGNGLEATLRDYARLGLLYAHQGELNGQRVFTQEWLEKTITPTRYPKGALNFNKIKTVGYGYLCWPSLDDQNDFLMLGLFGKFIYVDLDSKIVIAKMAHYLANSGDKPTADYNGVAYADSVLAVSRTIRNAIISGKHDM
ncbi:serine hydrolase [Serratia sp. AKBS12]|uniref:serine hydrolase domain-containing protein n=1 Tax=Serratia sp. AKBS12 TaxID=2974597 RepID=UPI002165A698|nr:serine hydrolase [Serratia sp. AKBS12]MCS3408927.1 beta-lactamase family protein [Serratia sp. AKBS12]